MGYGFVEAFHYGSVDEDGGVVGGYEGGLGDFYLALFEFEEGTEVVGLGEFVVGEGGYVGC